MSERAPIQPTPVDIPWPGVPSTVNVDAADALLARAEWDRAMTEEAGMLDATIREG